MSSIIIIQSTQDIYEEREGSESVRPKTDPQHCFEDYNEIFCKKYSLALNLIKMDTDTDTDTGPSPAPDWQALDAVLRIRDVYPGPNNKEDIFLLSYLFCSHQFHDIEIFYLFLNRRRKNLSQLTN